MRKAFADQGGANQRAAKAKAIAAACVLVEVGGNVVRKRRRTNDCDGAAELDSRAAWHWLQKWSCGKMSSIEVQNEAHNNYFDYQRMLQSITLNDGWMSRAIHQLAQLGTRGEHNGNINRELKHWLGEPALPQAMMATVTMVIPKTKDVNATMGMLSPPLSA